MLDIVCVRPSCVSPTRIERGSPCSLLALEELEAIDESPVTNPFYFGCVSPKSPVADLPPYTAAAR